MKAGVDFIENLEVAKLAAITGYFKYVEEEYQIPISSTHFFEQCVKALAERHPERYKLYLVELTKNDDPTVRSLGNEGMFELLQSIGSDEIVEDALVDLLADSDEEIRRTAFIHLASTLHDTPRPLSRCIYLAERLHTFGRAQHISV